MSKLINRDHLNNSRNNDKREINNIISSSSSASANHNSTLTQSSSDSECSKESIKLNSSPISSSGIQKKLKHRRLGSTSTISNDYNKKIDNNSFLANKFSSVFNLNLIKNFDSLGDDESHSDNDLDQTQNTISNNNNNNSNDINEEINKIYKKLHIQKYINYSLGKTSIIEDKNDYYYYYEDDEYAENNHQINKGNYLELFSSSSLEHSISLSNLFLSLLFKYYKLKVTYFLKRRSYLFER